MIKWLDSLNREWGIAVCLSSNSKMVNLSIFPPKGNYADTIQISITAFNELVSVLNELQQSIEDK